MKEELKGLEDKYTKEIAKVNEEIRTLREEANLVSSHYPGRGYPVARYNFLRGKREVLFTAVRDLHELTNKSE